MQAKRLLGFLADIEGRLFGLGALERRGENWVARQREISRIYFAIGLTSSILVGAIALLVAFAIVRGPASRPVQPAPSETAATILPDIAGDAEKKSPSQRAVGLGPTL